MFQAVDTKLIRQQAEKEIRPKEERTRPYSNHLAA